MIQKLVTYRTSRTRSRSHALHLFSAGLLLTGSVSIGFGQIQGSEAGPSSRAVQLPPSGRVSPGATVRQSSTPPPGSSVDTLSPQIQIQGSYNGSVPGKDSPQGTILLTIEDAVQRGLRTNLGIVGTDTASMQTRAQRIETRSALLPNISGSLAENAAKVNLAAEGFSANAFGLPSGSFAFPRVVGPFHYYDLHGAVQQSLLDITAIHNLNAANESVHAAGFNSRQAREEVVLAVAGVYLQLTASVAEVEEQEAEVRYAEGSYRQAKAQADAGNKAPIEANRSLVELQTEQQRLRSQRADQEKLKNQLARLIGLPLGPDIQLAEKLSPLGTEAPSIEAAIRQAWAERQDLKAAEAQLRAAENARKAAKAEYLPSASFSGQYGLQGANPNQGSGVFQASASLTIPIFQGGRVQADTMRADAVVAQREAELQDQRGAVELDVRNAYIDLKVADDQVTTAEANRRLATQNLQQSQDRFAVGVADSVEVVNSEESLAAADHDYVSSLFSQYLARVTLAHATGEAEKALPDLFRRN